MIQRRSISLATGPHLLSAASGRCLRPHAAITALLVLLRVVSTQEANAARADDKPAPVLIQKADGQLDVAIDGRPFFSYHEVYCKGFSGGAASASGKDDAPKGPQTPSVAEQLPGLHLLRGPWEPGPVHRESVMFVQTGDGRPTAKLLFDAEKVMAVHGADGKHAFEADKDFQVAPDGSGLLLPAASRIPFRKHSDLFPPKGSPNSIGHQAGQPATSLLFGEGHVFHDQQIEVTYVPRKEAKWTGYRPAFAGKRLPATLDKLRNKKALTIAVSGDSISQGYNASGLTKAPPFMPAYPNLVAAQLEKTYRAKVDLHNRAIAGWSVGQGVKDLDNLLKSKPDLVIIAYGMNDVGGRNPDGFKANIATMLRRIKEANAATEVILVASMMGNPDWAATPPEMFPRYRDALASLEGPGVVLADLTAVWQKLLERKRFVDMTGNGVNHPNDYGHRLYAQAILALLVPPDLVRGDPPSKPTRHVEQLIEGWTVHVEDRLLMGPDAEVGKRAIQILTMRLVDIKIAVPADKVARLQKVPIWLDRTHGKLKPAQYHPSIRWPKTNGYDEALVKCVHIPDAAEFASPGHQRVQPWSVLHELAHAYHDQVLGFDHAEIAAAWKQFKDSGRYEKVLHINGSTTRHYGLTNPQEFFAEMTESYFGTNDFFPFNRAELRREEPEIFDLLTRIWHEKPAPDQVGIWQGFERRDFKVDGRACLLIVPRSPAPGRPWIWRTEFFGHEPQADLALLAKGFHVAYMDVQNLYGAPVALDHMDRFYQHLTTSRGLSAKTVLEGFSRGGLFSLNWAARNPDKVACIYNDAPVCDFKSWPGGKGKGKESRADWQQCLKVYGLTEAQALAYKGNPVDNLEPLAKARIPLLHICGDADDVVPIDENTRVIETRYRKLGGPITVIAKPGIGHHPHSLENPAPIVAFVLKHTIGGTAAVITPESPSDYQVFQRRSRESGVIRVRGRLVAESGQLQCRLVGPAEPGKLAPVVKDWQSVSADFGKGRFDAEITAPAGGWYQVELRLEHAGKELATATIDHVGVGEVFVVAGQSNSTNHGSEKQRTTSGMVASFDGTHWVLAHDPQPGVQDGSGGGSFLPAFGDALYKKYRVPIGVASTGAGATSVRQWLPKGERMTNLPTIAAHVRPIGPGEWECTGALFDGLMNRIEALGPRGCRAVLWHQGESDAGQARAGYPADRQITGAQYRAFMDTLIRASRKRAGWEVPWFVAQATYHSEQDAADEEFRAAQKALWDSGLALQGPDTDALRKEYRAGVHFNAKGLQAHGQLWAAKVGAYLEKVLAR